MPVVAKTPAGKMAAGEGDEVYLIWLKRAKFPGLLTGC
jgi:hypothetical protein